MNKQTTQPKPNAFHWREIPSQINWQSKSQRQILQDATRVNAEATSCTFVPPERSQKIRKSTI